MIWKIMILVLSELWASNEVPSDETLGAIFDRFLLRVHSDNLDAYHFNDLLLRGIDFEGVYTLPLKRVNRTAGGNLTFRVVASLPSRNGG